MRNSKARCPNPVIDALIKDLNAECGEWAPVESEEDYYDHDLSDVVSTSTSRLAPLREALNVVRELLRLQPDPGLEAALHRLLFANVITALETYLSETFVNAILSDDAALRRYVETTPEFGKQSIPYRDIFTAMDGARDKAKQHSLSLVWHNLAKVQPMYHETLLVDMNEGWPRSQEQSPKGTTSSIGMGTVATASQFWCRWMMCFGWQKRLKTSPQNRSTVVHRTRF